MGLQDNSVKDSMNYSLGQAGHLTISDQHKHYGKYLVIQVLSAAVFATLTDELGNVANGLAFVNNGGTTPVVVGSIIQGGTSGATARVNAVTVTTGAWADGDADGWMEITHIGSTTFTASEEINLMRDSTPGNYVTVEADIFDTATEANGGVTAGDTRTGVTWAAGSIFYGKFSCIDLTSGSIEAYKG